MTRRVAFLGLGAMGVPMARNLARAGFQVRGWNRTRRPFKPLQAAGVELVDSVAEAVREADVVCVCVLDDAAARAVVGEALPHLAPDTLILDHGTLAVDTSRDLAAKARAVGASYLDAPVSGGTAGAEAGTLTIMAGGDLQAYERARGVLQALGERLHYMGPSGSGQITKLINQLLTAVHSAAAVEALHLGGRLGLEPGRLHEVLASSFGASRMLDRTVPALEDGSFRSAFTVNVLAKDLRLIERLGRKSGTPLPLASAAQELYQAAREAELGELDAAGLIRLLQTRADAAGSSD